MFYFASALAWFQIRIELRFNDILFMYEERKNLIFPNKSNLPLSFDHLNKIHSWIELQIKQWNEISFDINEMELYQLFNLTFTLPVRFFYTVTFSSLKKKNNQNHKLKFHSVNEIIQSKTLWNVVSLALFLVVFFNRCLI